MSGELVYDGFHKLGLQRYHFSRCVDCGSLYPHIDGRISCNRVAIVTCPWHGPDSPANRAARGDVLWEPRQTSPAKPE